MKKILLSTAVAAGSRSLPPARGRRRRSATRPPATTCSARLRPKGGWRQAFTRWGRLCERVLAQRDEKHFRTGGGQGGTVGSPPGATITGISLAAGLIGFKFVVNPGAASAANGSHVSPPGTPDFFLPFLGTAVDGSASGSGNPAWIALDDDVAGPTTTTTASSCC